PRQQHPKRQLDLRWPTTLDQGQRRNNPSASSNGSPSCASPNDAKSSSGLLRATTSCAKQLQLPSPSYQLIHGEPGRERSRSPSLDCPTRIWWQLHGPERSIHWEVPTFRCLLKR